MAGWEFPHGDAVRGLEMWEQALPIPKPCLQDRMQQVPSAEVNGQVGAPPRPLGKDMRMRGQDPPELHRSLPSVPKPHPAPGGRCGPLQPSRRCAPASPPPSEETYTATRRSPSCSGPKPWSTRLDRRRCPATGQLPHIFPTRLPTSLVGRPSRYPTSRRTQWRRLGEWTATSSAANSLGTDAAPGTTTTPPTLQPVEDGLLAVRPPGNRPHPSLVGQPHRVQRAPGRWGDHPRPVAARREDACLSPRDPRQGAHAPLPDPLARGLEA